MSAAFTLRSGTAADLAEAVGIDEEAMKLYAEAGVVIDLPPTHPFVVDEQRRWREAAERGGLLFAVEDAGGTVGFAALDAVDGAPYLDQLSVRYRAMRRGAGRFLLRRAIAWARERGDALWLTTYRHLPFNRLFYESEGFVAMPQDTWGPAIRHHIAEQRKSLPHPNERVAMRLVLANARL